MTINFALYFILDGCIDKRMKPDSKLALFVLIPGLWLAGSVTTRATDLDQLIPGLYGGQGITLPLVPGVPFGEVHRAHFASASENALVDLNRQLSSGFTTFPINSSPGSFTFRYDRDLGAYVNTSDTLGPIFAERATTVGRKKLSIGFYGTFFDYNTFNGQSLSDIHVIAQHAPIRPSFLETNAWFHDKLDIGVNTKASVFILSPSLTYGLTDKLDVSALIPIVNVDMRVNSTYHLIIAPGQNPATDPHSQTPGSFADRGSAFGIGDFVTEAKYRFLENGPVDLAGALLAQFPTGDANNFLGTGDYLVKPFLVGSRTFPQVLGSPISLTPHVNVGYQVDASRFDRLSAFNYVAGFDAGTRRVSLAWELLGYIYHNGLDEVNTAVGLRWNFWKTFVLSGNVILPLNDKGLRSDVIPTLGIEAYF